MEYRLGDDLPIGIYRSSDNVKYLSVKITLKKVTPSYLSKSDPFPEPDNSDELELLPISSGVYSAFLVEHVFSWQEKVSNQASTLDEDTADQDTAKKQKCQAVLFSYADSDLSLEEWQSRRPVTYPPNFGYLDKKISVRYRGKKSIPQSRALQRVTFSEKKPAIHIPSKKTASHQLHSVGQFMSIMVAFNPFDSAEKEERELCFLHLDPDGCLTVIPDFNVNEVPYVIQNSKSETFEFYVMCASKDIQSIEAETEKKIVKKLNLQRTDALTSLVGTTFDRPSSGLKFFLNGEIASSSGFSCDTLYVQYYFELPEGWSVVNEECISGSTYTCRSKCTAKDKVAYFGFPVCLEIDADLEKFLKDDCGFPGVQLFVEVISVDRWNNCRGEGYGYITIPMYPGSYSVSINTWKVLPMSLIQKLRKYFVGGTSYLEDITFARIPNSIKCPQLSKYGIKTESSGCVNVKYYAVFQTGLEDVRNEKYDSCLQA